MYFSLLNSELTKCIKNKNSERKIILPFCQSLWMYALSERREFTCSVRLCVFFSLDHISLLFPSLGMCLFFHPSCCLCHFFFRCTSDGEKSVRKERFLNVKSYLLPLRWYTRRSYVCKSAAEMAADLERKRKGCLSPSSLSLHLILLLLFFTFWSLANPFLLLRTVRSTSLFAHKVVDFGKPISPTSKSQREGTHTFTCELALGDAKEFIFISFIVPLDCFIPSPFPFSYSFFLFCQQILPLFTKTSQIHSSHNTESPFLLSLLLLRDKGNWNCTTNLINKIVWWNSLLFPTDVEVLEGSITNKLYVLFLATEMIHGKDRGISEKSKGKRMIPVGLMSD